MSKYYQITIFLIFATYIANSQTIWVNQQSSTDVNLTSIFFVNDSAGWITGYDGTILKTSNGGAVWQEQISGTLKHLSDVFFINDSTGWIVGQASGYQNKGIILSTSDGGTNWHIQIDDGISNLKSVFFINDSTGWAVGVSGAIKHTEDGGINWSDQQSGTDRLLTQVQFISSQIGWVSVLYLDGEYYANILKTYNAGETWISLLDPMIPYSIHQGFHFSDSLNGFATGFGAYLTSQVILRTTDGGYTWSSQSCESNMMYGIFSTTEDNGWAVGKLNSGNGCVFSTTNGQYWGQQACPSVPKLNDLHFVNDSIGWAIGNSGTIIYTDRGNIYTSIANVKHDNNKISCYPNPSHRYLKIRTKDQIELEKVEIFSNMGELAFIDENLVNQYETNYSYDLHNLRNGLYFIRIHSNNMVKTLKWIKH